MSTQAIQQSEYDAIVQQMAQIVLSDLRSDVRSSWTFAFIDLRFPPGGGSCVSKERIHLEDHGESSISLRLRGFTPLVFRLFEAKDQLFSPEWYGIKLTVFPDGRHTIEYNFDPDCRNDPAFFES